MKMPQTHEMTLRIDTSEAKADLESLLELANSVRVALDALREHGYEIRKINISRLDNG